MYFYNDHSKNTFICESIECLSCSFKFWFTDYINPKKTVRCFSTRNAIIGSHFKCLIRKSFKQIIKNTSALMSVIFVK